MECMLPNTLSAQDSFPLVAREIFFGPWTKWIGSIAAIDFVGLVWIQNAELTDQQLKQSARDLM